MTILAELASDDVLDAAYDWLCRRRRDYSANADVWSFRRHWSQEKDRIKSDLLAGEYRFSLLSRVTLSDGDEVVLWSARDPLVLKALSHVLARHLPVSDRCTHLKGHGGAKHAVREVRDNLPANRFVLKTDVKSYYASIDHFLLLDQLAVHIKDRRVLSLLGQYLCLPGSVSLFFTGRGTGETGRRSEAEFFIMESLHDSNVLLHPGRRSTHSCFFRGACPRFSRSLGLGLCRRSLPVFFRD